MFLGHFAYLISEGLTCRPGLEFSFFAPVKFGDGSYACIQAVLFF